MTQRNSAKTRRECFETHRVKDHLGRWRLPCHVCNGSIDPIRDAWEADHIRRRAEGGPDTTNNVFPLCSRCAKVKNPADTREIAKGKRKGERLLGIRRHTGSLRRMSGYRYDWSSRRYVKLSTAGTTPGGKS